MQSILNPYIAFKDNAREAMEFYRSVFGGKLSMNTFKEFQASQDPSEDNKIMHAHLDAENGMTLMGADIMNGQPFPEESRVSITLSGDNEAELRGYYEKLCEGGTVILPLEKAPWGDTFAQVKDRYGIDWMINIAGSPA